MTRNATFCACILIVLGRTASADPGPLEADPVTDGLVIAGTAAGALAMKLINVNDEPGAWNNELFGALDDRIKLHYSSRMRFLSDAGLVTSVAIPAGLAIGATWDRAAGDRALVFAESIGVTLLLTSVTKTLVARPRPYTYSDDPDARAHTKRRGRDARRSFFSGHAATAFAALATGGALYAGREPDKANRAMAWGAGAAIAGATVNWRLRAGEHFYSDIIIGALVGVAAGTIVPAIHTGGVYKPSGAEWAALAGGLVLGTAISQIIPPGSREERDAPSAGGRLHTQLTPLVLPSGGGGLGLIGSF